MKIMITDSKGDSISITMGSTGTFQDLNKRLEQGEMQLSFNTSENERNNVEEIGMTSLKNCVENLENGADNSNLQLLEQQVESCLNEIQTRPETQSSTLVKLSISKNNGKAVQGSRNTTELIDDVVIRSVCRLCASIGDDMIHMFGVTEPYKNIVEKIKDCLPIMVTKSDTLPKEVCRSCLEKLELCYKFHKTVAGAEKHFLILGGKLPYDGEKNTKFCQTTNHESSTRSSSTADEKADSFQLTTTSELILRPCNSAPYSPIHANDSNEEEFHLVWDEIDSKSPISKQRKSNAHDDDKDRGNHNVEVSSVDDKPLDERCKEFRCDICNQVFRAQASVNAHQRKHRYARSFDCSSCNKIFYSKDTLKMHKATHSLSESPDENEYSCVYCGKTFPQKLPLSVHIMTHTEPQPDQIDASELMDKNSHRRDIKIDKDRPFQCTLCDKSFDHSARLREHSSVHTGRRPYKCSICNKSFKRASARKVHMVIHTGEKPFKCDFCGTNFRRAGDMRRHKKTQHGQTNA